MNSKTQDDAQQTEPKNMTRRRTMLIDEDVWRMAGDIGGSNHTEGFRISVKLLHEALSKKQLVGNKKTDRVDAENDK